MLVISNNSFSKTYTQKYNTTLQKSGLLPPKPVNKDIVSFGYINVGPVPKDLQIYRAIGEDELKELLSGECVEGHSYATSDPRGWKATNWHNGFGGMNKEIYFVTFKTGYLDIEDRRDSLEDTRYGVEAYTINDIKNIRKGHNIHGELIYAPDFEKEKALDVENKKKQIKKIIDGIKKYKEPTNLEKFLCSLKKSNAETQRDLKLFDDYDELGSYCEEFPEIIDEIKPLARKNDNHAHNIMSLIFYADRGNDLPYVREYVNKCIEKNLQINDLSARYLQNQGKNEDLSLLLKMFEKEETRNQYTVKAMKKLALKEDIPKVKNVFQNGSIIDQYYLWYFFENTKEAAPLARFVLDKYKNEPQSKMFCDYKITALISSCCKELKKNGNIDDIKYLEPYANGGDSYANTDAMIALNVLMKKSE